MIARRVTAPILIALGIALGAGTAGAADSVYWVNQGTDSISRANLAGGGGSDIPIAGVSVDNPDGLAIDSAAGKLYWTNWEGLNYSIRYANLDGSGGGTLNTTGAEVAEPIGLAIDPTGGTIYWANWAGDAIYAANLDGSGGGVLNTTGALVEQPLGLAVHPAQNRIYWTSFDNAIYYANLDGSGGGGSLDLTGAALDIPTGVAIDASTSRIYWGNSGGDSIGTVSIAGGGGGSVFTDGLPIDSPRGIAIDPAAGRVFWAADNHDTLSFASLLEGGPLGQLDTTAATVDSPAWPVLLHEPRNVEPPSVSLAPIPRTLVGYVVYPHAQVLDCSAGRWAGDLLESRLYRAPQTISYQWLRNGAPIAGATSSRERFDLVGDYACVVTAANAAGATSRTSGVHPIVPELVVRGLKLNRANGTAKISAFVSGSGRVTLRGKSVSARSKPGSLWVPLRIKAKGKALRTLRAKGKAKVRVRIAYTPTGGAPIQRTRKITLRLSRD